MKTLKEAREELNMTQVEAAEYLGVSRRSYQTYENQQDRVHSLKYDYMLGRLRDVLEDENRRILTLEQIESGCAKVFSKYDVTYSYLFGSYAKGTAREESDVDLLVSADMNGLRFFELVEELRTTLRKPVDVLDLSQLSGNEALLDEILRDGIKIYG